MKGKAGGRVRRRQFTASPGIIGSAADGYPAIIAGCPTLHPVHTVPPMLPKLSGILPFSDRSHGFATVCGHSSADRPPARPITSCTTRKTVAAHVSLGETVSA
jgi:hypothetical protein